MMKNVRVLAYGLLIYGMIANAFVFYDKSGFCKHACGTRRKIFPDSTMIMQQKLFGSSNLFTERRFRSYQSNGIWELQSTVSAGEGVLPTKDTIPYGPHIKVKGKVVNIIGFLFLLTTMLSSVLTLPLFWLCWVFSKLFDNKRRRAVDWCVHVLFRFAMAMMFYKPKVEGVENLPNPDEGVLLVPNHTSMLDILTLSAFLPTGFKYVSKVEVLDVPSIGWQMQMAGHIPLKRTDRKSQVETVMATVDTLKNGNSVCMFPEGTRTKTGRINEFKKGPFSIATKSGARIVPISICNMTKWYPNHAAFPLAVPNNIVIKIHRPIDPKGKKAAELMEETFRIVEGGLPDDQKKAASIDC
mmetsp:Transcript_7159/g.9587  ORF Transcript_7159/g.9587 Transcript_7159/m.9587 type:complete len:355 (+) Transcript_7159:324-1388(+)